MFKDLELKIKENLKNKSNKANLEQCIKRNFIPELIFMLNQTKIQYFKIISYIY